MLKTDCARAKTNRSERAGRSGITDISASAAISEFSASAENPASAVYRRAVIDIGSNSVRLVVYEGPPRIPSIIFNEKVSAGLGKGLAIDGNIADEDAERALKAVRRFALLVGAMQIDEPLCVATAAVREAGNGAQFLRLARETGLSVRLLSGEEEAQASGYGVLSALPGARGVIADLGGGSLELARVSEGKVACAASFPLGVLRLRGLREGCEGGGSHTSFVRTVRAQFAAKGWSEDWSIDSVGGLRLFLVGGSWRSLARLDIARTDFPFPVMDQHRIGRDSVEPLRRASEEMSLEEIQNATGMSASRAECLPDAAALLAALVEILDVSYMSVSSSGLREGLLYAMLPEAERILDPFLLAVAYEGRRFARHGERVTGTGYDGGGVGYDGHRIDCWIRPLFGDDDARGCRLRLAACLLGEVSWSANPDFRAQRGCEIALHGNWRGIDVEDRVLLAQALHTSFGGEGQDFALAVQLASRTRLLRAQQWGQAIRLAQRLSAGLDGLLDGAVLSREEDVIVLTLFSPCHYLGGETVERRLSNLASSFGKRGLVRLKDTPQA